MLINKNQDKNKHMWEFPQISILVLLGMGSIQQSTLALLKYN